MSALFTKPSVTKILNVKVLISLGLLLFLICITSYIFYSENKVLEESNQNIEDTIEIEMTYDPTKESTDEEQIRRVTYLDQKISASKTDVEKFSYSLQKAFTLSTNRSEDINLDSLLQAQEIFSLVYDLTKDKLGYELTHEIAAWGYLFQFVSNRYTPNILTKMPSDIKEKYFARIDVTDTDETLQQKVFEGILSILDDVTFFKNLQGNKVFQSNSALIRSVYLDSYASKLTEEERAKLIEAIYFDIQEYNFGTNTGGISPERSQRLLLTAPTQIAFAKYIVDSIDIKNVGTTASKDTSLLQFVKNPDATTTPITVFDETYRSLEKIQGIDPFGKSLMLTNIKLYELGALNRETYSEDSVVTLLNQIKEHIRINPEIADLVQGKLNYSNSENGRWFKIFQDIFALAKKSPSLTEFLDSIGVTNY